MTTRVNSRLTRCLTVLVLALAPVGAAVAATPSYGSADEPDLAGEHCSDYIRTELYFGTDRRGGPPVGESEFTAFLDTEVTPRFPDGLTVLAADGQYRMADGQIVRERSEIVILFYPTDAADRAGKDIDAIRGAYTDRFDQESVLRADEPTCVEF